jgi:hypothetical protein
MKPFIIQSLATWRLTALLVYEDGPAGVFHALRAASETVNGPLHCFWCTSVWTAAVIVLVVRRPSLILWLALSAAAIFLEEAKTRLVSPY